MKHVNDSRILWSHRLYTHSLAKHRHTDTHTHKPILHTSTNNCLHTCLTFKTNVSFANLPTEKYSLTIKTLLKFG